MVLAAFYILSAAALYGKRLSQTVDPSVMTGYQLGIGGLVLVIGGCVFGGTLTRYMALVGGDFGLPDAALVGRFCAMEHLLKYNAWG